MRGFWAVPLAAALCVAAPAFADAQSQVQAARKAERRHEWRKALSAWKAAYKADLNAEYLIGIGDAYSHLGNTAEARKNYQAYLADPLALPANVEKVKNKLEALDATPGELPLPGAPALALPSAEPPQQSPALALPAAPAAKRGKKAAIADAPLPLPGLDLPAASPGAEKKVASAAPLELPGLPLPLPAEKPAEKKPAVAATSSAPTPPGTQVAMATPKTEPRRVPEAAMVAQELPHTRAEAGRSKTIAWVAAGVAVAGLGTGALFFSQANGAHSDLTGSVHSAAEAQSLLDKEKSNRTLSFVGLAAGLVSAGVATALFAF